MIAPVKVIHGPNDDRFDLPDGATVFHVSRNLADAFNIPAEAIAFVNGEVAEPSYRLLPNDVLEFVKQHGEKSSLDPDEKAQLDRIEEMLNRLFENESAQQDKGVIRSNSPIDRHPQLRVIESESVVVIGNDRHDMDPRYVAVIACLLDANGAWLSGAEMSKLKKCLEFDDRLDRLIAKLRTEYPKIGRFIEAGKGRGFRFTLT